MLVQPATVARWHREGLQGCWSPSWRTTGDELSTLAVTGHPTAAWTAQQLRNAFPENEAPRYLLHDRDSVFAHVATITKDPANP